jgi:hypothetical protein
MSFVATTIGVTSRDVRDLMVRYGRILECDGGGHDLRITSIGRHSVDSSADRGVWGSKYTFPSDRRPDYMQNTLRQDLWRAGHAHAGVWLILALVALRYVDEANLSNSMKWLVRGSVPIAAILVPAAFFLSVLSPNATAPNGLIYLAYFGALLLALGVLVLGVGLVRRPEQTS